MITIFYSCPLCGRKSSEMELTKHEHTPSRWEQNKFYGVAHEILECPCGMLLRWSNMKIEKYDEDNPPDPPKEEG